MKRGEPSTKQVLEFLHCIGIKVADIDPFNLQAWIESGGYFLGKLSTMIEGGPLLLNEAFKNFEPSIPLVSTRKLQLMFRESMGVNSLPTGANSWHFKEARTIDLARALFRLGLIEKYWNSKPEEDIFWPDIKIQSPPLPAGPAYLYPIFMPGEQKPTGIQNLPTELAERLVGWRIATLNQALDYLLVTTIEAKLSIENLNKYWSHKFVHALSIKSETGVIRIADQAENELNQGPALLCFPLYPSFENRLLPKIEIRLKPRSLFYRMYTMYLPEIAPSEDQTTE